MLDEAPVDGEWLNKVMHLVIQNSLSRAIRQCAAVTARDPTFYRRVFIAAFLSCWRCLDESSETRSRL